MTGSGERSRVAWALCHDRSIDALSQLVLDAVPAPALLDAMSQRPRRSLVFLSRRFPVAVNPVNSMRPPGGTTGAGASVLNSRASGRIKLWHSWGGRRADAERQL